MSGNKQDTSVITFYVLVFLGIVFWVGPHAWRSWIVIAMLATIYIGSHGESKLPSRFNSLPLEPGSLRTIPLPEDLFAIKPIQPIELPSRFNSRPLEPGSLPGGLTKHPSVGDFQPFKQPLINIHPFITHQPFEQPLINYTDVHNVIKGDELQAAKKAVAKKAVIDGLQSEYSLDATQSLAHHKALESAKVTNKRFEDFLREAEISAIASTATQHALKQNNSNTQQGYRTPIIYTKNGLQLYF